MSECTFVRGQAYVGTATIDHKKQKVFVVADRRGDVVSFAHVQDVRRERVDECDGAEIGRIKSDDGFDYFVSARVTADVDAAFHIVGLCK